MKLSVLGGGGVRMPTFVRAVLASRPGAFDEICLFEPDATRRATAPHELMQRNSRKVRARAKPRRSDATAI